MRRQRDLPRNGEEHRGPGGRPTRSWVRAGQGGPGWGVLTAGEREGPAGTHALLPGAPQLHPWVSSPCLWPSFPRDVPGARPALTRPGPTAQAGLVGLPSPAAQLLPPAPPLHRRHPPPGRPLPPAERPASSTATGCWPAPCCLVSGSQSPALSPGLCRGGGGVPRHAFSTPRRGRLASDAPASQAPRTGPRRNTWGPRRPLQPQGDRATVHTPPTGQALPCCLPGKRQDGPLGSLACPPLGPLAAPCIRPTCPQTFTKLPLSPAPTSVAGPSATQGLGAGPPGLRNGLFHFNGRRSCLLLPVL